jgi:hypothetical protein
MSFEDLPHCVLPTMAIFLQDHQVGPLSEANKSCSVLLHDVLVIRKAEDKYQRGREAEWLNGSDALRSWLDHYGDLIASYSDSDSELSMQDAAEQLGMFRHEQTH